jgi:hypothetical protein
MDGKLNFSEEPKKAGAKTKTLTADLVVGMRDCDTEDDLASLPGFHVGECKVVWLVNEDKVHRSIADQGKLLALAQHACNHQNTIAFSKDIHSTIRLPLAFTCAFQEGKFRLGFLCWTNDATPLYFQAGWLDPHNGDQRKLER